MHGMSAISRPVLAMALVGALAPAAGCSCSGAKKEDKTPASGPSCTQKAETETLQPQTFHKFFEKDQAAYYLEEGSNLLLAIRVKEELSPSEVMGKFLALIISKFDFICDAREKLILICYQGVIEEKRNVGMMVAVSDLKMMQEGKIGIDELSERAKYVEGLDLSSIRPLMVK
jgi:hypothetical protein